VPAALGRGSVLRYQACPRKLSEFFNKSPETISPEELRRYFIHLKTEKKLAGQTSTQTQLHWKFCNARHFIVLSGWIWATAATAKSFAAWLFENSHFS